MKVVSKAIAVLISLVVCSSFLVGCGQSVQPQIAQDHATAQAQQDKIVKGFEDAAKKAHADVAVVADADNFHPNVYKKFNFYAKK